MMSKVPPNPASNHKDPLVREAFRVLFTLVQGPKFIGEDFLLREYNSSGAKYLLFRCRDASGKWVTRAALSSSGTFWTDGATTQNADFDALKLNPAET